MSTEPTDEELYELVDRIMCEVQVERPLDYSYGSQDARRVRRALFEAGRAAELKELEAAKAELAEAKRGDPDGHLVAVYQVLTGSSDVTGDLFDGEEPRYGRVVARAKEMRAELEKAQDRPKSDATDGAHPAWWRGHDRAETKFRELVACLRSELDAAKAENERLGAIITLVASWLDVAPDDGSTGYAQQLLDAIDALKAENERLRKLGGMSDFLRDEAAKHRDRLIEENELLSAKLEAAKADNERLRARPCWRITRLDDDWAREAYISDGAQELCGKGQTYVEAINSALEQAEQIMFPLTTPPASPETKEPSR